jgi:histidinol phosphatase-like PHP family hydrolase
VKTNYHTHTYRCKHAVGDDETYVLSAIAAGMQVIGFADHCPWPFKSGYRSDIRMEVSMLDDYVSLQKMYAAGDGNTVVYYIEDGVATFSSFTAAPRTLEF